MATKRRRPEHWISIAALLLLGGAAEPESFEVALWANDDSAAAQPGVISLGEHPCGAIAMVRLTAMPPYARDSGPLGTELIVETDGEGGETARWSVPVDYSPVAMRGPEILLDHYGQFLWIHTNGHIRRQSGNPVYPAITPFQCAPAGPHADSDYALCAAMTDSGDGSRRLIHYEASCT